MLFYRRAAGFIDPARRNRPLPAVTLADGLQHKTRPKTQERLTATVSTPER
jgi:hypothetical protein